MDPKKPRLDDRGYEDIPLENERLTNYYKNIAIFEDAEELSRLLALLKTPLPTTFRITGNKSFSRILANHLEHRYFATLENSALRPTPIPWYSPSGLAFSMPAGRTEFRRDETYKSLHGFLVQETELGNISRQEAVSMLPPILLDVKHNHMVLDMCAAPGSKTCQLIERMHADFDANVANAGQKGTIPSGVVVANDLDAQRSHMMIHQLKRLHSPCLVAVSYDASLFPTLYQSTVVDGILKRQPLLFDRILCDVPCSGDGTLRKNRTVWKNWSHGQAMGLHQLQIDILSRGCQMLRIGGRIVYSTCSMNPIENEAVLAYVLDRFKGAMELVDLSDIMPHLKRCPGLTSWKVTPDNVNFYDAFEDVPEDQRAKMRPSFFSKKDLNVAYHLQRAMRIYPHLQDTGGFFIAVLEKKKSLSHIDSKEHSDEVDRSSHSKNVVDCINSEAKFDPFIFQHVDSPSFKKVQSLFGIDAVEFPVEQLMIRATCPQERNNLFLVSEKSKQFLEAVKDKKLQGGGLQVLYAGVLSFTRCDEKKAVRNSLSDSSASVFPGGNELLLPDNENLENLTPAAAAEEEDAGESLAAVIDDEGIDPASSCSTDRPSNDAKLYSYRLQNEALYLIAPYVKSRHVIVPLRKDLEILLNLEFPKLADFSETFQQALQVMEYGCHLFEYVEKDTSNMAPFYAPVWKGVNSLNLLINKKERKSIIERFCWQGVPLLDTTAVKPSESV